MALDFTYDPATDIGEIRFLISDTEAKSYAFTDAEIRAALTRGGSVAGAMPRILTALLSDASRRARRFTRTEDGADEDDAQTCAGLTKLLDTYAPGGAMASKTVRVTSRGRGPSDPCVR